MPALAQHVHRIAVTVCALNGETATSQGEPHLLNNLEISSDDEYLPIVLNLYVKHLLPLA
nr:MAG: hypothetical protein DIU68_15490 [Chloroflexota bacterium]